MIESDGRRKKIVFSLYLAHQKYELFSQCILIVFFSRYNHYVYLECDGTYNSSCATQVNGNDTHKKRKKKGIEMNVTVNVAFCSLNR